MERKGEVVERVAEATLIPERWWRGLLRQPSGHIVGVKSLLTKDGKRRCVKTNTHTHTHVT
jgi:hypothetical protein